MEISIKDHGIRYVYDANGTKVAKIVKTDEGEKTTDYLGGFQYYESELQFFPTEEGYVFPKNKKEYLYVFQYKDHLGNVRLSYQDSNGDGTIQPTEILEENNYYPFGLKQEGYNDLALNNGNEQAQKYKYNNKEWQSEHALNTYDYGARNYDPALGRFFNIDNYAEAYLGYSPYQYAANNPVYYVDVNGDYIYVYDGGKPYRYDAGKLFSKNEETGKWEEYEPEAGTFLATVYNALTDIYTAGKGGGDSSNSFGAWFLSLFGNDNVNAYIMDNSRNRKNDYRGNKARENNILIDLLLADKTRLYTSNRKFEKPDFFIVLVHELAHALSSNLVDKAQIDPIWLSEVHEKKVKIDEIFSMIIENRVRAENKMPIRTHYFGSKTKSNEPSIFEQSRIYNEDTETGQFQLTVPALHIYNNYKKSIENKGIKWKD